VLDRPSAGGSVVGSVLVSALRRHVLISLTVHTGTPVEDRTEAASNVLNLIRCGQVPKIVLPDPLLVVTPEEPHEDGARSLLHVLAQPGHANRPQREQIHGHVAHLELRCHFSPSSRSRRRCCTCP